MNTDVGESRGVAPPASCPSPVSDYTRSPPMHTPKEGGAAAAGAQDVGPDSNFLRTEMWRCCCENNQQEIKDDQPKENNEDLNAKLLRAQEENVRLRSVIRDVTEVNTRWQKYNRERTEYVQKLCSTIRELQQKDASGCSESGIRSQESTSLVGRCENLQVENLVLQKQLDDCERRYEASNEALTKSRQEMSERIELLEMQVRLQAEDFVAERKEKKEVGRLAEKCKKEFVQLNKKIRDLEIGKGQYKVYVCTCKKNYETDGVFCKVVEYQRRQQSLHSSLIQILPCQLLPRTTSATGLNYRGSSDESLTQGDSAVSLSSSPDSPPHSAVPQLQSQFGDTQMNKWFLVCPKCRKHFPPNLGLQFSSHMEKCEEVMRHCSQ